MREEESMKPEEQRGPEGETAPPPIDELDGFGIPAPDEFATKVRNSISRTEATSNLIDLSTKGFFTLFLDYLSTIFSAVFSSPDPDGREKEK